ncbi:hypothetical protein [Streptomyces yunnanensis]|uniref:Uncharacterized protein n=1 Tax=Streptomyces yunnanensis TaxID=156453 RepID=A0A9X8N0H8_9ACTN|nr:hypothetical protein [Streptomyces yunnanensis]SHM52319.1 hypothetical protein SAMN05216268_111296 [Streptomyces yunnanensis]
MSSTRPTRLEPMLDDVVAYLLPTESPDRWPGAVLRAAQLPSPGWGGPHQVTDLRCLAMVLHALAEERRQSAEDVPLGALQGAFHESSAEEEPRALRDRVTAVVDATGMYTRERGYSPLGVVWSELIYQWEPDEPMSDMPPGPSELRYAAARLAA